MMPLGQQVFYGRRVPSGTASWRTFVHRLELRRDLLQCPIRRRRLDACHQLNQSVIARLRSRTIQQCRLYHSLRHQPSYGSTKPFNRPRRAVAAVQDPDDVAPGLVWPHAPHCRKPGFELFEDRAEVRGGAAGLYLADRIRITGAQTGIAADPTSGTRGVQSSLGALGDQRSLEFGVMRCTA
jgi:hypothetical protein